MTPNNIIRRLSARYGVPEAFGRRMLPLLQRACQSEDPTRKRILDLVERSYVHEAELQHKAPPLDPEDLPLVSEIAATLHGWDTPAWLNKWTGNLENGSIEPPRSD